MVKLYDLSQPLNQEAPFWPLYPPFEVKFIKRKAEHGVNAQYIMTSNHMGTHLDAPLHFVTGGKSIDQIPLTQLYGPGVIVDVSEVGDLGIITPELIESKVEVKDGDILLLYTGFSKYAWYQKPKPEEKQYISIFNLNLALYQFWGYYTQVSNFADIDYYTRPIKLSQWYLVYGFASCNKVKRRIKMGSHMV